jgi:hypothetical protein
MIKDVFVVDAAAHSYNLGEDNYAVGRYSQAVVDAFYGAHYNLSPVGYRLPLNISRETGRSEKPLRCCTSKATMITPVIMSFR